MIIAVTYDGNVIRTPVEEFAVQNLKMSGIYNKYYANGIRVIQQASLDDTLLLFTESGTCFKVNVKDVPCTNTANNDIFPSTILSTDAHFCSILPTKELFNNSNVDQYFVVIMTKNHKIIRQKLLDYSGLKNGTPVVTLESDDKVVSVVLAKENNLIFSCMNAGYAKFLKVEEVPTTVLKSKSKGSLCCNRYKVIGNKLFDMWCTSIDSAKDSNVKVLAISHNGLSIKISENMIRITPRIATGVKIMNLMMDDYVLYAYSIEDNEDVLLVTKKGMVARLSISSLKEQHRGGVGKKCMNLVGDDKIVACCKVLSKI